MLEMKGRERVEAGGLTFIVQHELWDGNIQDHADQGIVILVTKDVDGKETSLLKFNCFDIEKSYIYGPENANIASDGPMMLGDTGTTALAKSKYFGALESLLLENENWIHAEGAKSLASSKAFPLLRQLVLTLNAIGDDGAFHLAEAKNFTALEQLNVAGNKISPRGEDALRNSPNLQNLKTLELV